MATSTVRPSAATRAQVRLKRLAPVRIEAEAGLVEHEDRRVGQIEDGEPEALPGAARQPAGLHAQVLVEPPARRHHVRRATAGRPRRRA